MVEFDAEKHEYTINDEKVPSVTEIVGMITNDKYAINEAVLRQASARGTRVHELCQLMDLDYVLLEDEEIEPEISGYLTAWMSFERDYKPLWSHVEYPMGSWNYGYAGTADRIGEIDGNRVVVDIKTTSSLDRVSQIALACQLSAYAELFEWEHPRQIVVDKLCLGVQLKADGKYTVYRLKDIEEKYNFDAREVFTELRRIKRLTKYNKV